ncbi:hypothetical protein ACVWZA_001447 [Sphingomonas sp. UYAg733]
MGMLQKSAASLGFYGDDLDPGRITTALGAEPTVGVAKGGIWLTNSGWEMVAHTGIWRIVAKRAEPADLDGQINRILASLTSDLSVWRPLADRYRGRFFCGLFLASGNEGLALEPRTLASIGERGLVLDLDIYGKDLPD